MSFKRYSIAESADVLTGFPFKSEKYSDQGTRTVRGENVTVGELRWDTIKCWNDPFRETEKYSLRPGDIVIGMDGSRVGQNRAQIKEKDLPLLLAQRVARLRTKEGFSQDFLAHVIKSNAFEIYINAVKTGTSIPHISTQQIKEFTFYAPDLPAQQRIATILSVFDDKIALNRQMNQTLEEMARSVFSEWFINFNYPGANDVLEDGLPQDWRRGTLSEVIEIKHGYAFKGEFFSDEETDQLLVTPGNFNIGGGFNQAKTKFYSGIAPSDYILNREDLIVTMTDLSKAGDTLGYSALVPTIRNKQILHNQRIGKIINKTDLPLKHYLYWLMRQNDYRNFVLGGATGSTVKHTSPTNICRYNFIIPSYNVLIAFQEIAKGIFDKIDNNETQSRTLTELRDSLLPKLMKGEIPV